MKNFGKYFCISLLAITLVISTTGCNSKQSKGFQKISSSFGDKMDHKSISSNEVKRGKNIIYMGNTSNDKDITLQDISFDFEDLKR
ncbi:MAG: hypothetical protein PHV37_09435 [Candidatus Gastranaerophilales bacterium]|nr:hypothetical protein [Candidatus Gastranaerophilales bacterium]